MRYQFYVFHNYDAVANHRDFIKRRPMDEVREQAEYERIAILIAEGLQPLDMTVQIANKIGLSGLSVSVTTEFSLFNVQLAMTKIIVDRNSAVEGLFLDFVQI